MFLAPDQDECFTRAEHPRLTTDRFRSVLQGETWKWASRMMGGAAVWFVVFLFFAPAGALFIVAVGSAVAALSHRRGLSAEPHTGPAGAPQQLAFHLQDRLGDWLLTLIWRTVRQRTDAKINNRSTSRNPQRRSRVTQASREPLAPSIPPVTTSSLPQDGQTVRMFSAAQQLKARQCPHLTNDDAEQLGQPG